jgi:hypothetical protein
MATKKGKKKTIQSTKAKLVNRSAKNAKPMELKAFLDGIHAHALAKAEAGAATGACLVTDPQTGQSTCVLTDETTCTKGLKGTFIGGPCGS